MDLCFTNAGTSEMHFAAALDKVPAMRSCWACSGVLTGAADGDFRMLGRQARPCCPGPRARQRVRQPDNAKKASSGIVNARARMPPSTSLHDAPLTADIEVMAAPISHWVMTSPSSRTIAADGALTIEAAPRQRGIGTLIVRPPRPGGQPTVSSRRRPRPRRPWCRGGREGRSRHAAREQDGDSAEGRRHAGQLHLDLPAGSPPRPTPSASSPRSPTPPRAWRRPA